MKKIVLAITASFIVVCAPWENPLEQYYSDPAFVVDSIATTVFDNDTLTEINLLLVVTGNDVKSQFRWRQDSTIWSAWTEKGIEPCAISLGTVDSGWHTLDVQTCYDPDGQIADSTFKFYRAFLLSITGICDTLIHRYLNEPCTLWLKTTGSSYLSFMWLKNGEEINSQKDTLVLSASSEEQSGLYQCRISNPWQTIYSDSIRVIVEDTTTLDFIKDSLNLKVRENSLTDFNLMDSCYSGFSRTLTFHSLSTNFDGDSLYPSGRYTLSASYSDSGKYRVSAYVTDDTTKDTFAIVILVENVNRAPVFRESLPGTSYQIDEGSLLTINLSASDPDGDRVSYFINETNLPHKDDCILADTTVSWLSKTNDNGAYYLKITAYDGKDSSHMTIDIGVGNVNLPPRIRIEGVVDGGTIQGKENDTLRFTVTASDPNSFDRIILPAGTNMPFENQENGVGEYDTVTGYFWYVPSYDVSSQKQNDTLPDLTFFASDTSGFRDSITINIVVKNVNREPSVTLLSPSNGGMCIAKDNKFIWSGSDADNDYLSYTLFIGTLADQLEQVYHGADTTFSQASLFVNGQKYFWTLEVSDSKSTVSTITRSFTTNNIPAIKLIAPENNEIDISVPVTLSWQGDDPDQEDKSNLAYDLYFGKSDTSMTKVLTGTKKVTYQIDDLYFATSYNWKVVANDGKDSVTSPEFSFSTFTPSKFLSSMQIVNREIVPGFSYNVLTYSISLPYVIDSIGIIAIAEDSLATILIGNDTVVSHTVNYIKGIQVGESQKTIRVFSRNNYDSTDYVLNINRTLPNTFQKYFGQSSSDRGTDIVHTKDSGFVVGGSGSGLMRLVKVDQKGESEWSKEFGNSSGFSSVSAMTLSDDGNIIVLGHWVVADSVTNPHVWLLEYQQNGTRNWDKQYRCNGYGYEYARGIVKADDGGYVVVARALSSVGADIWVFKTNPAGVLEWQKIFKGGAGSDDASCIAKTPDGGFVIGGYMRPQTGDDSTWIFKVDGKGDSLWSKTYPSLGDGTVKGLSCSDDGTIFICGALIDNSAGVDINAFIGKISSSGELQKVKILDGEGDQNIVSISKTSDGNFILSGWITNQDRGWDGWLLKANADCDTLWGNQIGSSGSDTFYSAKETYDGGYLISGCLYNAGMWIVKTDREGKLW